MLLSLTFLSPGTGEPDVLEASVFNDGKASISEAAAAPQAAVPQSVIPLGSTFGIKLFTDGLIVASLSDIYTDDGISCPAADAGLKPGDYLLKAGGVPIQNNAALAKVISASEGQPVQLTVKRGDEVFEAAVTPVYGEGSFKTGMWVRDSAAGIGTFTFYDPVNGVFAGLGHGICDMDTNGVMSLKSGEPSPITLCGIVKGAENAPGRLKGYFSSDTSLGRLFCNNETGVYGSLDTPPQGESIAVLTRDEVKTGPIQILASVDENGPKLYEATILKVLGKEQKTKNFVVKVTDATLLDTTGGIVQGMSGCPILQDGKLAGAITHVYTEDPTTGYGIFAETMCEESVAFSMSN